MKTEPQFKVFKKGVTTEPSTIVKVEGQPFDKEQKIAKYKMLGYTVYNMEGKEI